MARWIAVTRPFNYHWPDRSAVTHFAEPGDHFVKDEVADFAVEEGYATEGKADESSRSSKGKRARGASAKKDTGTANADHGSDGDLAGQDNADHDRPPAGDVVDQDAG